MSAGARRMRVCVGLTLVGGMLVIAGVASGLVGAAARLEGGRGWQPVVGAAAVLVAVGMSCGVALVALTAWRLSIRWQRRPPHAAGGRTGSRPADPPQAASAAPPQPPHPLAEPPPPLEQSLPPLEQPAHPLAQDAAGRTAVVVPPAQQKMTQIKNLYREVEQMGDAEVSAHWEELRERQHELIRQYFEQAKLGGADAGHPAS